ncbi:MAG TPA: homoserine dehydrogenase [Thermomicrobiaceae bacterium]|nr:homoserine dehydrogenase [Thermomicrobiaceae bacterium]
MERVESTVQQVGVAILGLGTVGAAVARTIAEQRSLIAMRAGVQLTVRAVLERGPERLARADLDQSLFVASIDDILANDQIQVVVETLGGEQPAAGQMLRALEAGKHVVTANKEALSKHFVELLRAAHQAGRALLFEASVGGGIPLMVAYRQILVDNQISLVRGIVNGTTNFILSQMAEQGTSYADALAEAQRRGYAEPDPTADVEGYDAAYKLAILASLMTGRHIHPDQVERTGIANVTAQAVQSARREGGALKLIARAEWNVDQLVLTVSPEVVPGDDLLAHVPANFNAVELVGQRVGPVLLYGQGAGPLPTASAVVSDIVEAARIGAKALAPIILAV